MKSPGAPGSSVNRPTREELTNLYLNKKMSIHQMAKVTGFSRKTILRWIRRSGIPRRTQEEINERLRRLPLPDKSTLESMYCVRRMSSGQIARELGGTGSWVLGLLERYGISRRTLSEAGMEFTKTPFSGNQVEQAYLLGFRAGDLHAKIDGNQVRIGTSTTHPAMWSLIHSLFHKYGRVNKSPAKLRGDFEWSTYGYLDRSFEFLIKKPGRVPEEISQDSVLFFSFLSGYVDAEGNFRIYGDGEYCAVALRINSEDEGILRDIKRVLASMGYHVCFRLARRKGYYKGKNYRRDVWTLGMFRKAEVLDLLGKLSLKHSEKIEWARLVLSLNGAAWSTIGPQVAIQRERIRNGVMEFIKEARDQFVMTTDSRGRARSSFGCIPQSIPSLCQT